MNFGGNLLHKSSYLPRVITLFEDKEQESQISSEEESPSNNQNNGGHHHSAIHSHNHSYQQKPCHSHQYHINQTKSSTTSSTLNPTSFHSQRYSNNLLQMPSQDYKEKSQQFLEKRIEQRILINHQKELYYGKRKHKVIEISDVSSEQESEEEEQEKQRRQQEVDVQIEEIQDEDQLLKTYAIGQFVSNNRQQQPKRPERAQQHDEDSNPLAHLHPDYEQEEKKALSENEDQESNQLSEIGSDKSVIVFKPKKKHIRKRLKKMANIKNNTNRVKIEAGHTETNDCSICLTDLNKKHEKKKGKLPCKHEFCLKCITEASKFSNRCPYCRATFNEIRSNGKRIEVEDTRLNEEFEAPDEEPCYICGRNDDFEHLLECQFCEYAYCHTYCDPRLRNRVLRAEEAWYCASCEDLVRNRMENGDGQDQEGNQDQGEEVEQAGEDEGQEIVEEENEEQQHGLRRLRRRNQQENYEEEADYRASQQDM